MNNNITFWGIIVVLLSFVSCSQSKNIIEAPSFLAQNTTPAKPSFTDNEIYDEYFQEGYDTLAAIDTIAKLPPSVKPWLTNINFYVDMNYGYTNPNCFSMGYNYGNYFGYSPYSYYGYNPYGYDPFGNFNYGINNQYGNCMMPSYWYDDYYYSMYAHGYYWGATPYSCGAGSQANYSSNLYNPPAVQHVYSSNGNMNTKPIQRPTPKPSHSNSFARATQKPKSDKDANSYARATPKIKRGPTSSNLVTKSSYSHKTKQRTNSRTGHYNNPRVTPMPTGSQSSSSNYNSYNRPTPSSGSSGSSGSYRPSSSNPTRATPSRSTPTRATPTRSAPTRSAPTRSTPTRTAPTRSAPTQTRSKSYSSPQPTRSAPSRSAPTRSAPR